MERGCGVLLPVSSIPNQYGFGCFSAEAYEFVDYLSSLGMKYWQILPLGIVDGVLQCADLALQGRQLVGQLLSLLLLLISTLVLCIVLADLSCIAADDLLVDCLV